MASFSAPEPETLGHTAPPAAVHVQVWLATPEGTASTTLAPVAGTVPLLVAVTV